MQALDYRGGVGVRAVPTGVRLCGEWVAWKWPCPLKAIAVVGQHCSRAPVVVVITVVVMRPPPFKPSVDVLIRVVSSECKESLKVLKIVDVHCPSRLLSPEWDSVVYTVVYVNKGESKGVLVHPVVID